ncbi:MAG: glycosyltransferase [Elusimicrobia bacterium]|nr:glycosyltransferase [Elusimicrobiota bacterium]
MTEPTALSRGYAAVVPMYDEESNAERCVRAVSAAVAATNPPGVVIVVDDGSRDRTREILRRLIVEHPALIVVEHDGNRGYGTALVTGAREAHRRGLGYVLFLDADLTTDPKYIADFVEKMRGDYDVIKATRYSLGGGMKGVPPHRVLISRAGNALARLLFRLPIADCTNGFRAVKTDILVRLPLREKGFAVIMEELYYLLAFAKTYAEVPYLLTSRGEGQGVSRFVYRPKVFFQYLKYAVLSLVGPPVLDTQTIQETR